MLSKLVEEFLIDYLKREPFARKEDIVEIISPVELLLRHNKDKSLDEIIDLIIKDNIQEFENIRKKYGVPGVTASVKVGSFNVKLYGGNINYLGEPMPINALFDIASMSKFYTQIIAYNLIKEGYFKRTDRIVDLDNRFVNLGNLTVDDILTFGTKFMTDGLIKDKKAIDEARDTLFHVNVVETGKWNYNDIGLMIMKEIMEKLTGLSYVSLVDKYIVNSFGLTDTHIIVPNSKYHLITGTPNFKEGHVNDMGANALGGYSGHAGVFASTDDLIKLMTGVTHDEILPNHEDIYTPSKYDNYISKMGNVFINNPKGTDMSYVSTFEPKDSFAIAGSTRTFATGTNDSAYNLLFNPSSMSFEEAKERVQKINEIRIKEGKDEIHPVREYEFNRDGKLVKYKLIDPRLLLPLDDAVTALSNVAKTTLKLRFLDFLIKKYDKNIKEINIVRNSK